MLTAREGGALYGLLAHASADIILKTDRRGFVVHASPAIGELGVNLPAMLIGPHVAELCERDTSQRIVEAHDRALGGRESDDWIEFPARHFEGYRQWFALRLNPLRCDRGTIYGTLGLLRCVSEKRMLEEELFAATMTDPLTGLSNRRACIAMLDYLAGEGTEASLALLAIDRFAAINIRSGPAFGDRVLDKFARFLREGLRKSDIISRIGNNQFAVIMTGHGQEVAETRCRELLAKLVGPRRAVDEAGIPITASGGVARIGFSADDTLRRAELALFHAKARGRGQAAGEAQPRYARVSGLGW